MEDAVPRSTRRTAPRDAEKRTIRSPPSASATSAGPDASAAKAANTSQPGWRAGRMLAISPGLVLTGRRRRGRSDGPGGRRRSQPMDSRLQKHPFWYKPLLLALACASAAAPPLLAQPSGGPYGPIPRRYEVPRDAPHVYYVAPDGKPEAPGTAPDRPTSIEAAIERVVTGDAVVLRGGTYRTGGLR